MFSKIVPTDYFQGFFTALQEIYKNPESLLNYVRYEKDLDNFHWAWPFGFDSAKVKNLVESVKDEKTFDKYMVSYFADGKDTELMRSVAKQLPSNQKILFSQVCNSYNNKDYAIANNAIMSILDNLLSKYVANKGNTTRYGIFRPIVNILYGENVIFDVAFSIKIVLLSYNIDFIFENYSFEEKISIKTNKKVRRHPSVHGFRYSNQKVDTLMLMNSLYELLTVDGLLTNFHDSLEYKSKKKEFEIATKCKRRVYLPLIKTCVLNMLKDSAGITQREILQELHFCLPDASIISSQYISTVLQNMKRRDHTITSKREDNKTKWYYPEQFNN